MLVRDAPLDIARMTMIISQVCGALAAAHDQGVVHRDMKPENIILHRKVDDDGFPFELVKVLDFGIAKVQDRQPGEKSLTGEGDLCGTPEYMSPEQIRGEAVDARADIYGCGVILYWMATGRLPFESSSNLGIVMQHLSEEPVPPIEIFPAVPSELEAIILRAMAKEPDDRYPSARDMRAHLRCLAGMDAGSTIRPLPIPVVNARPRMLDSTAMPPIEPDLAGYLAPSSHSSRFWIALIATFFALGAAISGAIVALTSN